MDFVLRDFSSPKFHPEFNTFLCLFLNYLALSPVLFYGSNAFRFVIANKPLEALHLVAQILLPHRKIFTLHFTFSDLALNVGTQWYLWGSRAFIRRWVHLSN